ncbi:thiol reductant ABC exporter subunit CydD [Pseudonocardia sp. KRD-184]|uniref:Thiol reductant ABC exporter subunit CydD n=1 Tax=Pseudonocardia oceani TaxID=2792013 RepID=A0ABS6UHF3_9PSEU|nr:thiol reductant ABC exporter subunit CydD [Pseudonocardia oceani]MBW0089907.1 thiol reductant ABC exporter subunit CydD [Pseudonocardia oceani]MBW0096962.1 thiol reductant ABC exporter subunit CydD [Pseudonocardia oceani]MBW0109637.1 thiol reductant ABC exporter subunit CydD [Pseudonocardia oceani]MBW0122507.1 thiol reductant ABC exporter subunit CydD [Pseudonocardia oceani]MBW0131673.1 thiol reductant ABC exporter subunit CydD [Pseudonocardia oceani]
MRPLDPRLLRHASAARRYVVLAAALAVATAGLVLVAAELLARAVDAAFLGGAGLEVLVPLLLGLLVTVTARAALAWAGEVAAHRASTDVVRQLRSRLVAHVLALGPRHRDLPPTGELATLATRGLDGLEGYFSRYLPTLLVAATVPAAVAGRILFADPLSGLIVGLTVPLIPIFMILVGLHTERSTRRQWRTLAVLGHHFLDLVAGMDVLVAFDRARRQSGRLHALADSYRQATMRTLRVAFLSALVLELLATLSVALVAVSVGLRLVDGRLDLVTALVVLVLVPEVYLPLRAVGARFHDSAEGLAAAAEVFAVLEVPVTGTGRRIPAPDPSRVPMRLDAVTVDGRGGRVLDGFDLVVGPGAVLGVRGPSGSGKSTLVDLLLGLRRPDDGRVTVGGVDLADVDRDAWSRRVAWVPQRPVLVRGTVADNIRLGAPDATAERVAAAADAAALDVPLDRSVGEDGVGLSTGQQRRVALARAVLADRPLLLLDEPTEGVDAGTEAAIVAALPGIAAGRTVVLVSHRAELLAACDRVVTVEGPDRTGHLDRAGAVPASLPSRTPTAAPSIPPAPRSGPVPASAAGALRWSLSAARGQRRRLVLAALLGALALGSGVALTATSAWLISSAALHPPVLALMVAIVAVRAFGLAKGVLRYAERLVSHDAALRAAGALRVRIWEALVRLGPAATARLRRGELLSRLVSDVDAQQDLLVRVLVPAAAAAAVGLGAAVGIGLLLPAAGLVVAAGVLVAGVVAPAVTAWAAHRTERRAAAARGEVLARTVELVEAAPDLIAFGAAARFRDRLAAADARLAALLRRAATARGVGAGIAVLATGATSVAATAVGVAAVRAGTLPGPALAVLALTPLALADVVAGLPDAAVRLLTALPAARRLAELEAQPATVAQPAPTGGPRAAVPPPSGFTADGLAVRWPGAATDAVRGVDLGLCAGTRLALTGPSGSGKSTVVAALLRTLDPSAGALRADGRDVRELTGTEVRSGIAWCGARTHLFDSTLRANLTLAAPGASDEQLVAALGHARLGDWLAGLPDGLDTAVGEHGGAVSGGERQRIGVTRALLAERNVLVLDEPTAHLDPATADALAAELLTVSEGRTALIVTHRPEQTPGLAEVRIGDRTPVPAG